ncbi:amino acid dehydrogenase [beta proteobacterium AAP51]|nr:amino acid dehydrogenase [beta proteobacterium AAP51]
MRIAIIGAGIVGVTTAYELALAGHEVSVFEQRGSVAAEGSFASAGLLASSSIAPWCGPGVPWRVLRQAFSRQASARLGSVGALAQCPWLWRAWRAGRPAALQAHRAAMHRLAQFSRQRLLELTQALRLEFEQAPGHLLLLRTAAEVQAVQPLLRLLTEAGVTHELADADRCRVIEPGLNEALALKAGVHFAQDGVGNCRQFAHLLKTEAQRLGASFFFEAPVQGITPGAPVMLQRAGHSPEAFDAAVLCAGAAAAPLLARAGVKLPLQAVHGYSMTAPLRHVDGLAAPGPRAAITDARHRISITRLGQRVRVAGVAELGGRPDHLALGSLRLLHRVLDECFPGAALTQKAQHWKGARPVLPDGPPVLGASGAPGVWLNLGHGDHGWTLACGSARVLAETLSGREPPLDATNLTIARLQR